MNDGQISPGQVDYIPIDHLQPNPLQPRGSITADSLTDLVDSIRQHGVLEPLVVAHTPAGLQIIAGERRWRASKIAGLDKVPAVIKETTPQGMLEMAIIENVQRTDLNPLERGKAFERLQEEFSLQVSQIAERIGKSAAYISNSLRLLKLPDALKDGLLTGVISEGHARALAAIEDTRVMIEAYKIVLKENASVRRAEELARRFKHQINQPLKPTATINQALMISDTLDKLETEIQQSLGENATVKLKQSRRLTKVIIFLKGRPEDTQAQLERIHRVVTTP
jgi:ParB family transcriptional regulator, chromosome partitioning protein